MSVDEDIDISVEDAVIDGLVIVLVVTVVPVAGIISPEVPGTSSTPLLAAISVGCVSAVAASGAVSVESVPFTLTYSYVAANAATGANTVASAIALKIAVFIVCYVTLLIKYLYSIHYVT
jgi:hypothetical protein